MSIPNSTARENLNPVAWKATVLSHPNPKEQHELRLEKLKSLDVAIDAVVLQRQHPVSGLLPASTANTVHGNYGDAWVRDCVYSIQCVWGLAIAHRRLYRGSTTQRSWELEQRVLGLMRGLLNSMMRQASKVERFKYSLDPLDALHAKYNSANGDQVVADDGWGHLQLDATSLFLLQLAQLSRGGLAVVRNRHEVAFIQNLVYYVARAYRVPDFGIWERGDKGNQGLPERNASSIGMAKAALEALDGVDLFSFHGDGSVQVLVPQGAVVRLRRALQGLLPRESASKEVDSACLSVIGYPAWAVEERDLVERTVQRIRRELGGPYGYKRFRRDGHQTVVEDVSRLHYERTELVNFEGVESEWPLFLAYEQLTACCEERWTDAHYWQERLRILQVERHGQQLYPELYLVPDSAVELERRAPGSQQRLANDNVPLLWTQSLAWLGDMLIEGLIEPADLDPCGRRFQAEIGSEQVLVALAPTSSSLAAELKARGLPVSDPQTCPIQVVPSSNLNDRLSAVGGDEALHLSGQPMLRADTSDTARLYQQGNEQLAVLPAVLEEDTFFVSHDPRQLMETVINELHLLQRHWRGEGSPLLLIPVEATLLENNPELLIDLTTRLNSGQIEDVPVCFSDLETLAHSAQWVTLPATPAKGNAHQRSDAALYLQDSTDFSDLTAAQEQELDDIPLGELRDRLWSSHSLREQAEVLELLKRQLGHRAILSGPQGTPIELVTLLEEIYHRGLSQEDWNVARRCAGAMGLVHPQLEDAVIDLLSRQKQVVVGRNYTSDSRLSAPASSQAIAALIESTCGNDGRERMLQQELLVALDGLARREPEKLKGTLTLQLGQLLLLLTSELAAERQLSQDEAFEALCSEAPHAISLRLQALLNDVDHARAALQRGELLHLRGHVQWSVPEPLEERPSGSDWLQHRMRLGSLQQVPKEFYAGIWSLLHHCRGLVIGDKLERRNRLTSALVLEKTPGERNFAIQVEHLLSRIEAAEYRQLCTESLLSLMAFTMTNPDMRFEDDIALDVVIGHAVRVGWQSTYPEQDTGDYSQHKAAAWKQFYLASPAQCRRWQIKALKELAEQEGLL
ncbi:glycoside hydrolase family 15 protein [Synechococcus sp. WH 8020]|uniref:glycoside hydrolase family 15 protein n=1 Tax=Synechococcus sp. (strain WH8020) TaxID=32052 RepID=UPI001FDF0C85|nr:glycoside hydrolase family 15 protein [Synechococcus sp. WH 8020]